MTTIASRLTSTGTLLVNGRIDEVTQSTISTTANTVFAGFFDEVSNAGTGPVRRDSANNIVQLSGIFDEFTGAPVVDNSLTMWIDFGQTTSYSGTGNTVYDISPAADAYITLYGSPTFNSTDGGGAEEFDVHQ